MRKFTLKLDSNLLKRAIEEYDFYELFRVLKGYARTLLKDEIIDENTYNNFINYVDSYRDKYDQFLKTTDETLLSTFFDICDDNKVLIHYHMFTY